MSTTVNDTIRLFSRFTNNIIALLKHGRPTNALEANDATLVDGHTLQDFREEVKTEIQQHIDQWNPHELSAWYLDSPTKEDVEEARKRMFPSNVMPISYMLKSRPNGDAYYTTEITGDNMVISLKQWPVALSGAMYVVPPRQITVNRYALVKLYIVVKQGKIGWDYVLGDNSLAESHTRMYVGIGDSRGWVNGSSTYEDWQITRVDLYRFNKKPVGSSLPIIDGWDSKKNLPIIHDGWIPDPGHVFIDESNYAEYREGIILPKGTYSLLFMTHGCPSVRMKLGEGLINDNYPYYTTGAAGRLTKMRFKLDRVTRVIPVLTPVTGRPDVIDWTATKSTTVGLSGGLTGLTFANDNGASPYINGIDASGKTIGSAFKYYAQTIYKPYVQDGNIFVPIDAAHTLNMTAVTRDSSPTNMKIGSSDLMSNKWQEFHDIMMSIDPDVDHGFGTDKALHCGTQGDVPWAGVTGTDGKTWNVFYTPAPGGFGDGTRRSIYLGSEATLYGSNLTKLTGYGWGAGGTASGSGTSGFISIVRISD